MYQRSDGVWTVREPSRYTTTQDEVERRFSFYARRSWIAHVLEDHGRLGPPTRLGGTWHIRKEYCPPHRREAIEGTLRKLGYID